VCNDIGAWGAGFVLALSKKWSQPEAEYRRIPAAKRKLGYVQYIPVGNNTYVVNMIAQTNIKTNTFGVPPIRYEAVETCLKKTAEFARSLNNGANTVSIHMPRIGCGLAGGKWEIMEKVIEDAVDDIPVTVYDFQLEAPKQTIGFTTSYGVIPKNER
jgi:O-acetyl-ADP-ribose deacetylase (regulator of RNase III)